MIQMNSELIKSLILGIVQGLTEFLPVSSSGHLVIIERYLDFKNSSLSYDLLLHFGTFLITLLFFRKQVFECLKGFFVGLTQISKKKIQDIWRENEGFRLSCLIVLAIIPAGVIGVLFKDYVETIFREPYKVFCMLGFTGFLMLFADKISLKDRRNYITWQGALFIGCGQALAVIPGISRSGTTLFCALLWGLSRQKGAEFSFLISLPVIGGAGLLEWIKLSRETSVVISEVYVAGIIAAMISGYLALRLLMYLLKDGKLKGFGYYCLIVSLLGLIFGGKI